MKTKANSQAPIIFNGTFDDRIRQALKAKRLSVGVSLQQLGAFLEIHWSTLRKWEVGITASCHPRHVARVTKFLAGAYDASLRALSDPEYARKQKSVEKAFASSSFQGMPLWFPKLEAFLESIIDRMFRSILEELRK